MREMTEAERERITAEIAADPDQLAEFMAGGTPLALRRWIFETAVAGADASVPNADGRDEVVERLCRTLLHPAATENTDAALDLFRSELPADKAVRALDALAGTGGGRSAN